MKIVKLGCRCGTLWFFNRPSAEILISSLKFDQFDPFSQMTQKVCQKSAIKTKKHRNSESAGGSDPHLKAALEILAPWPPIFQGNN